MRQQGAGAFERLPGGVAPTAGQVPDADAVVVVAVVREPGELPAPAAARRSRAAPRATRSAPADGSIRPAVPRWFLPPSPRPPVAPRPRANARSPSTANRPSDDSPGRLEPTPGRDRWRPGPAVGRRRRRRNPPVRSRPGDRGVVRRPCPAPGADIGGVWDRPAAGCQSGAPGLAGCWTRTRASSQGGFHRFVQAAAEADIGAIGEEPNLGRGHEACGGRARRQGVGIRSRHRAPSAALVGVALVVARHQAAPPPVPRLSGAHPARCAARANRGDPGSHRRRESGPSHARQCDKTWLRAAAKSSRHGTATTVAPRSRATSRCHRYCPYRRRRSRRPRGGRRPACRPETDRRRARSWPGKGVRRSPGGRRWLSLGAADCTSYFSCISYARGGRDERLTERPRQGPESRTAGAVPGTSLAPLDDEIYNNDLT